MTQIPNPPMGDISMDEVHGFLSELSPDDTGREVVGGAALRFEGFTDLCIDDAMARTRLPKDDPRHLADYDAVFEEVLKGWADAEGVQAIETGFAGTEENPTIWAVYPLSVT